MRRQAGGVDAALPGVTISTTAALPAPVPVPPSCERFPGVKTSVADVLSDSGCKFGAPVRAAATISAWGPGRTNANGFLIKLSRCLGAFCSATIHALAFGSACGTGTLNAFNFALASGANGDNG